MPDYPNQAQIEFNKQVAKDIVVAVIAQAQSPLSLFQSPQSGSGPVTIEQIWNRVYQVVSGSK
jgi:hypothetical protein